MNDFILDDIIVGSLDDLNCRLEDIFTKYGLEYKFDIDNFEYELFQRCESLYIPEKHYRDFFRGLINKIDREIENTRYFDFDDVSIPSKLGVYRGYSGGGVHSGLVFTETHEVLDNEDIKKVFPQFNEFMGEIENEFRNCFWSILKQVDEYEEVETGEKLEIWETRTL